MYLLFLGFLLIRYRYKILGTPYLALISSLGFLGLSMIVDIILTELPHYQYLIEDGFKFLGILGWFYYFTQTSYSCIIYSIKKNKESQSKYSILPLHSKAEGWSISLGQEKRIIQKW